MRLKHARLVKKLRVKSETSATLSLTERSTLALLDEHKELLPTELAAMEKITAQSMSQVLNYLSELEYITRKQSKTDGRKTIVSLSKKGQHVLYSVRHERDEWLHKALRETCSVKEQEMLQRATVLMTRLVDFD